MNATAPRRVPQATLLRFVALVVVLGLLGFLFIWLQWSLIVHPAYFLGLVALLVLAGFLSSAMEAAFSVAVRSNEVLDAIDGELTAEAVKLDPIDQKIAAGGSANLSPQDQQTLRLTLTRLDRLKTKREMLVGEGRDIVIGSLATTSLLLNTALTAFLPLTIIEKMPQVPIVSFSYPWLQWQTSPVQIVFLQAGFTNSKLLVFFASSIPALLLGKIIPKIVGLKRPKPFAFDCYFLAAIMARLFGWITLGMLWPTRRLIGP
jgi:hypothetical protein